MNDRAAVTVTVRPHETQREPCTIPPGPPAPAPHATLRDTVRVNSNTSM